MSLREEVEKRITYACNQVLRWRGISERNCKCVESDSENICTTCKKKEEWRALLDEGEEIVVMDESLLKIHAPAFISKINLQEEVLI